MNNKAMVEAALFVSEKPLNVAKISEITGDSVPVVDLVIWRFATIRSDYLLWFRMK